MRFLFGLVWEFCLFGILLVWGFFVAGLVFCFILGFFFLVLCRFGGIIKIQLDVTGSLMAE